MCLKVADDAMALGLARRVYDRKILHKGKVPEDMSITTTIF
jgi:hypothetical protein